MPLLRRQALFGSDENGDASGGGIGGGIFAGDDFGSDDLLQNVLDVKHPRRFFSRNPVYRLFFDKKRYKVYKKDSA